MYRCLSNGLTFVLIRDSLMDASESANVLDVVQAIVCPWHSLDHTKISRTAGRSS